MNDDKKPRGIFTISIDVELAWSDCDKPLLPGTCYAIQKERDIIQRILGLFSKYNIRATWAIVGHLLSSECKWEGNMVHPEFPRPIINNSRRDWFFQHPKNQGDPLWYGEDIIQWIKNALSKQDIASHSFCHVPYSERNTNRSAIKIDIEKAKNLHQAFDLTFEVFVFPRNIIGFKDMLSKSGIRTYRGKSPLWYDHIPFYSIRRLLNLIYFIMAVPPPTVTAVVDDNGMVKICDSMLLLSREGLRAMVSSRSLIKRGVAGLDLAVKRGEIFHLWFHPSNFAHKTEEQFYILQNILNYAQLLREKGYLEILTMGDIQRRTIEAIKISSEADNVKKIRDKAIEYHEKTAACFDNKYKDAERGYFTSAFGYGRKKLEDLLIETVKGFPKGSRLLDIGCGTGEHLKKCRELGFNVTGIEPSASMRVIAQRQNPGATILSNIISNLPLKDESFDFVFSIEVLRYLHCADIQQAYKEVLRVLKPGGLFFFTMANLYELNGFYIYYKLKKIIFYLFNYDNLFHCEFVTPKQIKRDLNKLGFEEIKFYGRMFALLSTAYKINARLGSKIARYLEPFIDSISQKKYMIPFAGHLIVIARRPTEEK